VAPVASSRLAREYAKACDVADFDDPRLRARLRDIAPQSGPDAELHRKLWEYATLALFLEDVGLLDDQAELLSVGAGHEEVLFWLANHVGRMVATDIYGRGAFSEGEADAEMLTNAAAFAPYPYREARLEVLDMDALDLRFDDASFDAVFSLSSIEHFGHHDAIERASAEIGRVVRPGGYAFIVTECYLGWHPLDSPVVQTVGKLLTAGRRWPRASLGQRNDEVFTLDEIRRVIIEPSGLELLQQPSLEVSPETRANVIRFAPDGSYASSTGRDFPHVLLRGRGGSWTSLAIPLHKPA
jgi:SAM-dependent methyltransferase